MLKHVLVYGTLKSGQSNHNLLQQDAQANYVATTRVPGYDLYHLGGYPGIRQNPQNKQGVECELYELSKPEKVVESLDWLEGYYADHPEACLFFRREVFVDGVKAYIYEYGHDPKGRAKVIEEGVW